MSHSLGDAWRTGRNNFDALRLVAAWLVILSHAWPITGVAGVDPLHVLTGGKSLGGLAIDVFFLASGLLVAASVQRHRWPQFLLARAARIYPALLACMLLTVFVLGPVFTTAEDYWRDPRTWRYLWANATLWRAEFWLPGVFEDHPWTAVNGSLWTLPIEARLYVALLLASLLGLLTRWRYLLGWIAAIAGALAFAIVAAPLPQHLVYLTWTTAFFITGTLAWVWREHLPLHGGLALALLALAVLSTGRALFVPAYFVALAYGTLWLAFRPRLPGPGRIDLSYGLYLYGWPMQQLALLAGAASVAANTALATVLALGFAALSWFVVERPALAWVRRRRAQAASRAASGPSPLEPSN